MQRSIKKSNKMNVRGIKLLRELRLPSPDKEVIGTFEEISILDLDWLYQAAPCDVTLVGFDARLPINLPSVLETDVRLYKIKRPNYQAVLMELSKQLSLKGIPENDQRFMAHQTYSPDEISASGKMVLSSEDGFGSLAVDVLGELRRHHTDFHPEARYQCPVVGGRIFRSQGSLEGKTELLGPPTIARMIKDIYRIPGSPQLDFEITKNGSVFYHDASLTDKRATAVGESFLMAA